MFQDTFTGKVFATLQHLDQSLLELDSYEIHLSQAQSMDRTSQMDSWQKPRK
jgi:hypothetical protein